MPPYWTSVTAVAFSFTPFAAGGSGGIKGYQYGLGSAPGADDVVGFQPYNGSAVVRGVSLLRRACTRTAPARASPCTVPGTVGGPPG